MTICQPSLLDTSLEKYTYDNRCHAKCFPGYKWWGASGCWCLFSLLIGYMRSYRYFIVFCISSLSVTHLRIFFVYFLYDFCNNNNLNIVHNVSDVVYLYRLSAKCGTSLIFDKTLGVSVMALTSRCRMTSRNSAVGLLTSLYWYIKSTKTSNVAVFADAFWLLSWLGRIAVLRTYRCGLLLPTE